MIVEQLEIPEVLLIKPSRFGDERGFFQQTFQKNDYAKYGIKREFVQDNHSFSEKGVLRGLHYQHENPQAKLVSVITGSVFDVAVDLRKDSATFGQWVGRVLSAENGNQMYVPRGFAHGFLVLSETVNFIYKCDDFYLPGDEYTVLWDDETLNIEWPLKGLAPNLSPKDRQGLALKDIPDDQLF